MFWRALAAGGIGGGVLLILVFAGVFGEDGRGSVGLLLLGLVLLAIGIPSLLRWLKTF